eukprot:scaffold582813_cov15-Prasinocladus_malaysianus.AAC.1
MLYSSLVKAASPHLAAIGCFPYIVLVAFGDHQVPVVIGSHIQAGNHSFGQAAGLGLHWL